MKDRSKRFLSRAKKHARADRFEAVQAAAIEWLTERPGPYLEKARIVWHERFEASLQFPHAEQAPEIGDWLELTTFFTELRLRPNCVVPCGRNFPCRSTSRRSASANYVARCWRPQHAWAIA